MKKTLKKVLMLICLITSMLAVTVPASAMSSSKSMRTGYKKNQVIKKTYGLAGSGRKPRRYTMTKDIYVSEKVVTDRFVKYITKSWVPNTKDTVLSASESSTISGSGSVDIIKALGFKASFSISKSESSGFSTKPDPKKGNYCRLALKCDYIEVTYNHCVYNSKGKMTSSSKKTVLIPIKGSQAYYIRYNN